MQNLGTLAPRAALDIIEAYLPRSLRGTAAYRRVREVIAGAPPLFQWHMLEYRPARRDSALDFLAAVLPTDGARALVANTTASGIGWPLAASVVPLLHAWGTSSTAVRGVDVIWFEWDAPFTRSTPFVLPFLSREFTSAALEPSPRPDAQIARMLSMQRLLYGEPDADEIGVVARVYERLAQHCRILGAFPLYGRGRSAYRLYGYLPPSRVQTMLRSLEWRGDQRAVDRWLPVIVRPWERAYVQLEVEQELTPYLGLEAAQVDATSNALPARRQTLDLTVRRGQIPQEHADDLLRWVETEPIGQSPDLPEPTRSMHFKYTFGGSGLEELKGYLGWCFRV